MSRDDRCAIVKHVVVDALDRAADEPTLGSPLWNPLHDPFALALPQSANPSASAPARELGRCRLTATTTPATTNTTNVPAAAAATATTPAAPTPPIPPCMLPLPSQTTTAASSSWTTLTSLLAPLATHNY